MSVDSGARGTVITFYSYKGGTGRSMALANVACLLGEEMELSAGPVLAIDWDLEAPGLDRFLVDESTRDGHPGIIEYFYDLRKALESSHHLYKAVCGTEGWRALGEAFPLTSYVQAGVRKNVSLLGAGRQDESYPERIGTFDWETFYKTYPRVFNAFHDLLSRQYSYALVDSRTGLTDAGGICTALLPEKLVAVFTPNEQSLMGVMEATRRVLSFRSRSDDLRSLAVFPLPSRVELDEEVLRRQWRGRYQKAIEETLRDSYKLSSLDLSDYLDEVQIPQKGYYAFGEKIAVLEERRESLALSTAYEKFAIRLVFLENAWDRSRLPKTLRDGTRPAVPGAEQLLEKKRKAGRFDVFLSYDKRDAPEVLEIAKHLRERGVRAWLDRWEVQPGQSWRGEVEAALTKSDTIAVVLGSSSRADDEELSGIVGSAEASRKPVIPVLLPGADTSDVPRSLRDRVWLQFRSPDDPEALDRLVWGVTGQRPTES